MSALKVAGIDSVYGDMRQAGSQRSRLPTACLIEGNIPLALVTTLKVVISQTMTDK
jgi:hypothetical protein